MTKRRAVLSRRTRPTSRRRAPGNGRGSAEPRWAGRIAGALSLLALAAGVAGQYLGLWKDIFSGDEPSPPAAAAHAAPSTTLGNADGSPSACSTANHGVVLKLEGAPTRSAARVTATVSCVLAPGDHLSWVVRKTTGTASVPHVHYTLRDDLDQGPGTYLYEADLHTTAPGSERTLFVVVMDSATYQSVKQTTDPATNYVLLPSPPITSNTVMIKTPR